MNLGQAYQGWQQQSQNRQLYVKTREAFRKAWFTLPTNQPCSYYTKQILGEALAATREIESNKAKAASVMIHVLTFANFAEPKFNPKPDFTLEDLMEYTRGPLADPEKTGRKQEADDDDPVTAAPRRAMEQEESADTILLREKAQRIELDIKRVDIEAESSAAKPKPRGRAPRPVAQIDPATLEVVKVWPAMGDAERETGACNLDRAIKLVRKSAGYYWCNADDADTFKDRLAQKQQQTSESKAQQAAKMREAMKAKKQQPAEAEPKPQAQEAAAVSSPSKGDGKPAMREIPAELYERLDRLGMLPNDVRDHNRGASDYSRHLIQPWAIWQEYRLNPFDADIIKRVLRHKATDPRRLDYEKIIHICQERIRQIDHGEDLIQP